MITDGPGHGETLREPAFRPVIKKEPPDTPGFFSMGQIEVCIAIGLETGIDVFAEWRTCITRCLMPVQNILIEWITRRKVKSATKVPGGRTDNEETQVGVEHWNIRISRMQDHRDSAGFKTLTLEFWVAFTGCGGEGAADAVSKLYRTFFEDFSPRMHARASMTAIGPRDFLSGERLSIEFSEGITDSRLQRFEVSADSRDIRLISRSGHRGAT